MAENTAIEWADHTFNPWTGCTKVSPACDHCYAEAWAKRSGVVQWGPQAARRRTSAANWRKPPQWNSKRFMQCDACGWRGHLAAELIGCGRCGSIDHLNDARPRVFCASLADVFDNQVPHLWRQNLMSLVADTPNIDWLFLTKRVGNAARMLNEASMHDGRLLNANDAYRPPKNLWLGATICNQEEAERDIKKLLQVPAQVHFVSVEPMLGPIDLTDWLDDGSTHMALATTLDWVICGGESGPGARPMHPQWARDLRDQCANAGAPFLLKQWGEWAPAEAVPEEDHRTLAETWLRWDGSAPAKDEGFDFFGGDEVLYRVGKKHALRLLDGCELSAFPSAPHKRGTSP